MSLIIHFGELISRIFLFFCGMLSSTVPTGNTIAYLPRYVFTQKVMFRGTCVNSRWLFSAPVSSQETGPKHL